MAATVKVYEYNTINETENESSYINYSSISDDPTYDWNVSKSTGPSYQKYHKFKVTGGTYTSITDLVVYTDGSNNFPTGVEVWAKTTSTFATPVKPTSSSGYADIFNYTSASPLSLGSGPYTGTGKIGDYLVTYCNASTAATEGHSNGDTFTFQWDEI